MSTSPPSETLAVDHLVIVVTDLEGAASRMEDLGFFVTARSDHPFGTSNRIVMLDDTYLEFVTVTERSKLPETGFARYIDDALAAGRLGTRLVVFRSNDPEADHARLTAMGLDVAAPLRFGRDAFLPDGTAVPVEFVVVLPIFGDVTIGSFVCQHLTPGGVWHPTVRRHANGAGGLARVAVEGEPAVWELMAKVSAADGPPMTAGNTTIEEGSPTIVVTAQSAGSTIIEGTTVTVEVS